MRQVSDYLESLPPDVRRELSRNLREQRLLKQLLFLSDGMESELFRRNYSGAQQQTERFCTGKSGEEFCAGKMIAVDSVFQRYFFRRLARRWRDSLSNANGFQRLRMPAGSAPVSDTPKLLLTARTRRSAA